MTLGQKFKNLRRWTEIVENIVIRRFNDKQNNTWFLEDIIFLFCVPYLRTTMFYPLLISLSDADAY